MGGAGKSEAHVAKVWCVHRPAWIPNHGGQAGCGARNHRAGSTALGAPLTPCSLCGALQADGALNLTLASSPGSRPCAGARRRAAALAAACRGGDGRFEDPPVCERRVFVPRCSALSRWPPLPLAESRMTRRVPARGRSSRSCSRSGIQRPGVPALIDRLVDALDTPPTLHGMDAPRPDALPGISLAVVYPKHYTDLPPDQSCR